MSGFNSYKIRDGVHVPSKKYKEGWDAIFGNKTQSTKKVLDGASKTKKRGSIVPRKDKVTKTL